MSETCEVAEDRPSPQDMGPFLEYACKVLRGTFLVRVNTREQEEYVSKIETTSRKSRVVRAAPSRVLEPSVKKAASSAAGAAGGADAGAGAEACPAVRVELVRERGRVVGVELRARTLPCLLLRVLRLTLPFHAALEALAARRVRLDRRAVRELAALLPASRLADLRLDDSPALERDHHLLLGEPCALRSLSLARCGLDDAAVAQLAAALEYPRPAARTLAALSLPSNRVTDEGARKLTRALRSNRALRHLDLADNLLTDDGAVELLRVLGPFPLTAEEVVCSRRWALEHLRLREELFQQCAEEAELARGSRVLGAGRRRTRRSVASLGGSSALVAAGSRARQLADQLAGPLLAPFQRDETYERGGFVYCVGNCAVVSLNLAYNELGAPAAHALLAALTHQAALPRRPGPGLRRAVLEGNPIPAGPLLEQIDDMLLVALTQRSLGAKRSERMSKLRK